MGTKRPFADADLQDADQGPDLPGAYKATKWRKQYRDGKHKAKEGTSEFAKKRARNIKRLLQRKQDLPANIRNDLERELASRETDIADKGFQKKRSAMIAKYHMVRFFERKKASRLVRQLKRQMEEKPDSQDIDRLREQLHVAEVDEAYTLYHPHVEPYISLYGGVKKGEAEEDADKTPAAKLALEAERPPMWSVIEKTMQQGTEALQCLRERRWEDDEVKKPRRRQPPPSAITSSGGRERQQQNKGRRQQEGMATSVRGESDAQRQLNRRERRRLLHQAMVAADDTDGDGGGGFFEEV